MNTFVAVVGVFCLMWATDRSRDQAEQAEQAARTEGYNAGYEAGQEAGRILQARRHDTIRGKPKKSGPTS